MKRNLLPFILLLLYTLTANSQVDIELYEQFNGRYDFTFVGNTLNLQPNGAGVDCSILTSSSAELTLNPDDTILRAYLYWAGSGSGDFEIQLNGQDVVASRTFPVVFTSSTDLIPRDFFSAFADVTTLVQTTGNGTYTVSDLDLTDIINNDVPPTQNLYCVNGTNFGGWAIFVVYENDNLPLNQLNLYDGLQFVPNSIDIELPSLNVIDNIGAKIGFIAWEGDENIANNEVLSINGITLGNPPLNPSNNAFNGTNSVTGASDMYNMDLDIYDIQNLIQIGDESADISLESAQDFVMVNAIITKLNSQLPDATIEVDDITLACNSLIIEADYTVYNVNSTDPLPAGTPIAIYANGVLVATTQTQTELPIDGSESGSITITLPAGTPTDFELVFVVDDNGTGTGTITETNENNNSFSINVSLLVSPPFQQLEDITVCETFNGSGVGVFDFSAYEEELKNSPTDVVRFYTSMEDAENETDHITNPENYTSNGPSQIIYVRLQDENGCYSIGAFALHAVDCLFPDATISINDIEKSCDSRIIEVAFTVYNLDSDDILPAGTPISIYANGQFIEYTETLLDIAIGGSEDDIIVLTIPDGIPMDFELTFVVDDDGTGNGIVQEIDETNNSYSINVSLVSSPVITGLEDIISCNEGFGLGTFDFSDYEQSLKQNPDDIVAFYLTQQDAEQGINPITNTSQFITTDNPQEIFVRLNDEFCYSVASFLLYTKNCPPQTYNYVTPNGDGINDTFFVRGLRNIFLNFKMSIYNRWGALVWVGDHSKEDWDGIASEAKVGADSRTVPVGTYYFVLELNDPDYPQPIVGWVYVSK